MRFLKQASLMVAVLVLMTACFGFNPGYIAKTDVDMVAEAHRSSQFANLRVLATKLYQRNPHEWKKIARFKNVERAVEHLLNDAEMNAMRGDEGMEYLSAGMQPNYHGDRVKAFIGGLARMLHQAYEGKKSFFFTDELNPQKLYNSARNVENAAWILRTAKNNTGNILLLSNEISPGYNLTFEREFGKLISSLDNLAVIAAQKEGRTLIRATHMLGSYIFLPVLGL